MLKVLIKEIQVERRDCGSGPDSTHGPDACLFGDEGRVPKATIQNSAGEVAFFKVSLSKLTSSLFFIFSKH